MYAIIICTFFIKNRKCLRIKRSFDVLQINNLHLVFLVIYILNCILVGLSYWGNLSGILSKRVREKFYYKKLIFTMLLATQDSSLSELLLTLRLHLLLVWIFYLMSSITITITETAMITVISHCQKEYFLFYSILLLG